MVESKRQLWKERFEEQSNSEMTIDAWCSQNQISKHTFYYWKQRIRKDKMDRVEENTASPLFAKLEMPATAAERITEAGLIIRWRGFELILSDQRDISLATQFIRQLSQS
ncbi:IS66 family insertion sequence element accessory protein TnpA [Acetobacterium carbinolicum]|uniref:IS66 family insertion sequence element accessory protein TnpA n=1 Tax=Acetobacterium carbinolicum TaxID=52690 RepID=UPI0039BEEF71